MTTRDLLRLISAQICLHATMSGLRLAAPLLALQLGYSAFAVGLLIALFALTQVFLALPAGRFADRHGLQRPLRYSVLAASVGVGSAALWPSFPTMCLAALATGGATGATVIALQRHVGRAAVGTGQLRRVFSWLAVAPALANFVGPFGAGLLIDHAGREASDMLSFRVAFFVMALMPLACWLLARKAGETALDAPPKQVVPSRALDLFELPMFRRVLFVNWLQSSSWDVHAFMLPLLGHALELPASVIGTILGGFAIAAAAIRVLLPLAAARVPERSVIFASSAITVLVFVLYPLLSSPWTMGACSVLLGFALGAVQPMVMSMLHQITPPQRLGEALGLRMMLINASSVGVPMLAGSLGAAIGTAGVFWLVAATVLGGTRAVAGLNMENPQP